MTNIQLFSAFALSMLTLQNHACANTGTLHSATEEVMTSYISSWGDSQISSDVIAKDIERSPSWKGYAEEPPPLSPSTAIRLALGAYGLYSAERCYVHECRLVRFHKGDWWYFVVELRREDEYVLSLGLIRNNEILRIVVLMSGEVLTPTIRQKPRQTMLR